MTDSATADASAMAAPSPLAGPAFEPMPARSVAPGGGETGDRISYRASGGRRLAFSFIFLLLLPFYVSLAPMLATRIAHGLWIGTPGLAVLAIAFTLIMFLLLVEVLSSIRARVDLGRKAVRMTLPAGRGLTSALRYETNEVAYSEIEAVEMRREVYGGSVAPMMLKGARVVTKDGRMIRLGYVNEANDDPAFPCVEIAQRIANRAGVALVDGGSVRCSARRKMLGLRSEGPSEVHSVDEMEVRELNRRHARLMIALVTGLVVLMALGIIGDMIDTPQ